LADEILEEKPKVEKIKDDIDLLVEEAMDGTKITFEKSEGEIE